MISLKDQESLLLGISRKLTRKMTVYAIGGTAMMFLGYKEATLDIDLVFTTEKDRKEFIRAAKSLGYIHMDPCRVYGKKENQPIMLKRIEERLDLFLRDVISFTFSEDMKKRANDIHEFGDKLIVKIANLHDIILMKCVTDRVKDMEDIKSIISNSQIEWDIILGEAKRQIELGRKRPVFYLIGTLLDLRKAGIKIPEDFFKRIWSLI